MVAAAPTRLTVIENETPGFFDPVRLCHPILELIPQGQHDRERSALELEKAKSKTLSAKVQALRKQATGEFVAAHAWVPAENLTSRCTARHPICIHAALLRQFVARAFPAGDHYVAEDDVAWLTSRAPALPPRPENHTTRSAENGNTDTLVSGPTHAHRGGSEGGWSRSNTPPIDERDDDHRPDERSDLAPWWTVTLSNEQRDVSVAQTTAPWSTDAQSRLLTFELPFGLTMTLDPMSGLVRATDMAVKFNKRAAWWLKIGHQDTTNSTGTRGVVFALASMMGRPPAELVFVVSGENAGTWIHARLMFHFAGWCHPPLAVHVNDIALRFYSGQLTSDQSQAAFEGIAQTVRPAVRTSVGAEDASVGGVSRVSRRLDNQRARLRDTSTSTDLVAPFDIPPHFVYATGVYLGNYGIVTSRRGRRCVHLKAGKAVEQPVTFRVRDHANERPHTFQMTWMASADASACWLLETAMKNEVRRRREGRDEFESVPGTCEEWLVPIDIFPAVHADIVDSIETGHASLVTTAAQTRDAAPMVDLRKHEFDGKMALLRAMVESGDAEISARAVGMLERMLGCDR